VPALLEPFSADLQPQLLPAGDVEALYVHVPFCFHKCHYCDFYSITRQTPERMRRYVDLVLREADRWTEDAEGPTACVLTSVTSATRDQAIGLPKRHKDGGRSI